MLADILPKIAGFDKRETKYSPRPSLAGPERCIRQMVYWAAEVPRDELVGDRFILTMDDSTWHEELTGDWINRSAYRLIDKQMPFDVDVEEFTPDLSIRFLPERRCSREHCGHSIAQHHLHGHSDGALEDVMKKVVAYEHKALNHFGYQRYVGGEWPLDYITQTCLWIVGLQDIIPSVNSGLLLIKNKNTAQYLEFLIEYDRKQDTATVVEKRTSTGEVWKGELFVMWNVIESAVRRFYDVHNFVMNKTLPPRPYEYGTTFPCGYCGWETTCWSTYEEEVGAIADNEADLTELADSARFYNELGGQIRDMEKQRDDIGKAIKERLTELDVRKGTAGEYLIQWPLQKRVTMKKKDEVDPHLLPMVTKTTLVEPLNVKKRKQENNNRR